MRCKFLSAGSIIGRERLRQSHWIEAQRGLKLVNKFKMARNSEKEATRQHNTATTTNNLVCEVYDTVYCVLLTGWRMDGGRSNLPGTFKDILN